MLNRFRERNKISPTLVKHSNSVPRQAAIQVGCIRRTLPPLCFTCTFLKGSIEVLLPHSLPTLFASLLCTDGQNQSSGTWRKSLVSSVIGQRDEQVDQYHQCLSGIQLILSEFATLLLVKAKIH